MLLALADEIEKASDELGGLESMDCGKPLGSAICPTKCRLSVDVFRFMAGAARCMTGVAAGEYVADHTSMIRRRPGRRLCLHRALELSTDDGVVESWPRRWRRAVPLS